MNKVLLIALIGFAIYALQGGEPVVVTSNGPADRQVGVERAATGAADSPELASRASEATYGSAQSGSQIQGSGKVIRLLSDDNNGSRHQRFIISLRSGQTLLVAHNIDLAPRIPALAVNDTVRFNGEYEWNSQGGVVHWTHHDPRGAHQEGWLKHKGSTYK